MEFVLDDPGTVCHSTRYEAYGCDCGVTVPALGFTAGRRRDSARLRVSGVIANEADDGEPLGNANSAGGLDNPKYLRLNSAVMPFEACWSSC